MKPRATRPFCICGHGGGGRRQGINRPRNFQLCRVPPASVRGPKHAWTGAGFLLLNGWALWLASKLRGQQLRMAHAQHSTAQQGHPGRPASNGRAASAKVERKAGGRAPAGPQYTHCRKGGERASPGRPAIHSSWRLPAGLTRPCWMPGTARCCCRQGCAAARPRSARHRPAKGPMPRHGRFTLCPA